MQPDSLGDVALELVLLACALAAALLVRPWRLLAASGTASALATPVLAALTLLPFLWAWPGSAAMPVPLQWSGAALAALALGWPLAILVLLAAGMSTMVTTNASLWEAVSGTVWLGVLPATAVLLLGHVVRRVFGTHPAAYLLGRAFAVPLVALFACTLGAALVTGGFAGNDGEAVVVTALLMSMAETSWTCALVSVLVAWRPQWLATWSDALYLRQRRPAR
jgi:hypothetical protein